MHNQVSGSLILLLLFLGVLGTLLDSASIFFAATPANVITNYMLWTLLTAGYFETDFILTILNIAVTFRAGRYLEDHWESHDLVKYLVQTNVFAVVSTMLWVTFGYMFTGYEPFFFSELYGYSAVLAALSVALWQQMQGVQLIHHNAFSFLKYEWMPFYVIVCGLLYWIFTGRSDHFFLSSFGTFYSWFYLRFFKVDPLVKLLGDNRDEFALHIMFPNSLRPFVQVIGIITLKTSNSFGLLKREVPIPPPVDEAFDELYNKHDAQMLSEINRWDEVQRKKRKLKIQAIDERIKKLESGILTPTSKASAPEKALDVNRESKTSAAFILRPPPSKHKHFTMDSLSSPQSKNEGIDADEIEELP